MAQSCHKLYELCTKQCGRPVDFTNTFKTCCRPCALQRRLDMVRHDPICDVRYNEYNHTRHKDTSNDDQKSNDTSKWRCVLCNWFNKSYQNTCHMCNKERPNKKRKYADICPDSIASPLHICTHKCALWCTTTSIHEPPNKKQKTDHIQTENSSDQKQTEDESEQMWKCSLCTFINDNASLQCKMCETQKDHEEPNILQQLQPQQDIAEQNKNDTKEKHKPKSSMKEEMDSDDDIDHESDNDVALEMFKNGITPDVVQRTTPQNNSNDCFDTDPMDLLVKETSKYNNNKQSDLLFALQISAYLKQSGFTCIENDFEDRYIANIVAETALGDDEYWNAHNMANTIPWMDGGSELDNLIDGFDHGTISSKKVYNKTTKATKIVGYDANGQAIHASNGEIDEDSVERVNIHREFQYAMSTGKIVRCRLIRRRKFEDFDDGDHHFRICESQFMRSCNRGGLAAGVFINGMQRTLKEVTYVINPELIRKFQAKKKEMKRRLGGSGVNTILAWHGTSSTNVDSIVSRNFSISHLSKNSGDTGYYGAGIYFSEFANISQGYGDALLLCKLMLGKTHKMNNVKVGCDQKKGYDSHMAGGGKYGTEIVMFNMDQILPCYIVNY